MESIEFSSGHEDLNLWERLKRVFYAPSTSFVAARGDPGFHDWLLPTVLVVVVWVGMNWLTLDIVTDRDHPVIQEQLADMPEDNRQRVLDWMEMTREHGWYSMPPVVGFAMLVVIGLALLAVARWIFRSDATLRDMLVVKAYASIIGGAELCARTFLILLHGTPQVYLSPGALLSPEMRETLIGRILTAANLFDCWQAGVVGIGLSVMVGMPHRRGMVAIVVLWGIWVVAGAALAGHPTLQGEV